MVRLLLGLSLFCSLATASTFGQDNPSLRVEEDKMSFRLLPHPVLQLPIVNSTGKPNSGKFTLSLLNTENDSAVAWLSGKFTEAPGETIEKIDWAADHLPSTAPSYLGWCRLQYSFEPDPGSGAAEARGIVQLGPIIEDGFSIDIAAADKVGRGTNYPVRVHVENPLTHLPYANIPVDLVLELGNEDSTDVKRQVRTDRKGNATVIFKMPSNPSDDDGNVTATVARGPFSEKADLDFEFPEKPAPEVTLTTDKPLYQPGQIVHMRLLTINSDKRAMAGAKLVVTIEDESGSEQFHEQLTASRFGVASADWTIPNKVQLGDYTVHGHLDSDEAVSWREPEANIRISRYDLPTFVVSVDPDRTYYLPGSNAVVDVHADYLFGKKVEHGQVRIVRKDNQHWDSKTQKWVVDGPAVIEGELGSDGHFKGTIDLAGDFKEFSESPYERFQDIALSAYLTDPSTGRTEQRRFNIRISAQPIHLYVLGSDPVIYDQPFHIYISSFYADGTPVAATGRIFAAQPTDDANFETGQTGFDPSRRRQIGTFHTNRFGVGRADISPLLDQDLKIQKGYSNNFYDYGYVDIPSNGPGERSAWLVMEASDSKGLSGHYEDQEYVSMDQRILRIQSDHTLYHPGDSIQVALVASPKKDLDAVLNVWSEKGLLSSQMVSLIHGHASATVPYDPRFRGEVFLTISTMTPGAEADKTLLGSTEILYPARQELDVTVKMPQTTFKPGEHVSADVRVRTPEGHPTESALGVLVFDRAVAERVRTDQDFGRDYGYSIFDYFDSDYRRKIGSVSYRDLLDQDATKPFPEGLDLVAEGMMHTSQFLWWAKETLAGAGWDGGGAPGAFNNWLAKKLQPARNALDNWYKAAGEYPTDEASVRAVLAAKHIDWSELRDPWGNPFAIRFSFRGESEILELVSSGIDKKPGTGDDFVVASFHWPYFNKIGRQIDRAASQYFSATGKYIRDYPTLKSEIKKDGIDLDALRDPWGRPYFFAFDISGPYFRILVDSGGPDGTFNNRSQPREYDHHLWASLIHYFANETAALNSALVENFKSTGSFPQNEDQLNPILAMAKLTSENLRDPWGHPYRFEFSATSRYSDRVTKEDVSVYSSAGTESKQVTRVTPVTQQVAFLHVFSDGPDKEPKQPFSVAEFSRVLAEQSSKDKEPVPAPGQRPLAGGSGGIYGVVTDQSGAVIANAGLTLLSIDTGVSVKIQADSAGAYAFTNLAAGFYQVECEARGFRLTRIQRIPVVSGSSTKVDITLEISSGSEVVEVTAEAQTLQTTTASISSLTTLPEISKISGQSSTNAEKPLFTPRVRKYFPETLVWRPELITDKRGRAHFDFPMADNITAWKMSLLASNEAGEVGIAEKELRSFQPFFLENDPPKSLTEGDRVSLPIVLRNYTEEPLTVSAEMQAADWFTILAPKTQTVTVPRSGDASPVFTIRSDRAIRDGKLRVTARNQAAGDSAEREITVHPNGQEISFTLGRILAGEQNSFDVHIPENAIPGSVDSEIRIYPNLLAHALDAMYGIGKLPAGCAEQITSTSYVSLLALQLLEKGGQEKMDATNPRASLAADARAALQSGYDQVVSLQNPDGGFRYWKNLPSNEALTAYVLRFLNASAEFIKIDPAVRTRARDFLVAHQAKSGAWQSYDWTSQKLADDPNLTAYIARALATTKADPAAKDTDAQKQAEASLKSALDFLEARIDSWSDPYLAGNYAIAAAQSRRPEHIANAAFVLRHLAHREGDAVYWNLEANTSPFYGWGFAGRLETTSLAVEALTELQKVHPEEDIPDLISRGLQFLLTHKDRYATWYSTQATQNVLEALIAALPPGTEKTGASEATLRINGRDVRTVSLGDPRDVLGPVTIPLPRNLTRGANKIEIIRPGSTGAMNATLIASYYIPWADSDAVHEEAFKSGETRALRFKVHYDRTELKLGDTVHCTVEAERIGFRGYGMMLAEVGLPPGAEVDRSSLEIASVSSYEIQPDKVVFYLWPTAGGTSFSFDFRTRYRLEAMTAPSEIYDYYNPEARAVVAPLLFTAR
jgi:hypothetical protein